MIRITNATVTKIFDSRGEPTIEIALTTHGGTTGTAQVPSGKSRGTGEVSVVSFDRAVRAVRSILPSLRRAKFSSPIAFDRFLSAHDNTKDLHRIGGNCALGLSLAFARVMAAERKQELWELIEEYYFSERSDAARSSRPMIFSNIINGGVHAMTSLSIQEYIAVAAPVGTPSETVARIIALYREVGAALRRKTGLRRLPLGDEGGYAVDFKDNAAPLTIMHTCIKKLHFDTMFSLAIDAAASEFFRNGKYHFEGKKLSASGMADVYASYCRRVPSLVSVEDPCAENDAKGFALAHARLPGVWIVGDDLTVTSAARIGRYIEDGVITGVIIKPNQIGTLSATCDAIMAAQKRGARVIVSHRSGETGDNAIIHIAKACAADAVKIGAPARERLLKFNEYIRIFS